MQFVQDLGAAYKAAQFAKKQGTNTAPALANLETLTALLKAVHAFKKSPSDETYRSLSTALTAAGTLDTDTKQLSQRWKSALEMKNGANPLYDRGGAAAFEALQKHTIKLFKSQLLDCLKKYKPKAPFPAELRSAIYNVSGDSPYHPQSTFVRNARMVWRAYNILHPQKANGTEGQQNKNQSGISNGPIDHAQQNLMRARTELIKYLTIPRRKSTLETSMDSGNQTELHRKLQEAEALVASLKARIREESTSR